MFVSPFPDSLINFFYMTSTGGRCAAVKLYNRKEVKCASVQLIMITRVKCTSPHISLILNILVSHFNEDFTI